MDENTSSIIKTKPSRSSPCYKAIHWRRTKTEGKGKKEKFRPHFPDITENWGL
jgi:hypothetical protein